ncbi:MAG: NAD-binding protein [Myxococcales bacterium]|nr:NAD-binding protein [Myxococcales bacterium]MDH3844040.1 NAD-binding protein [Myxococcales bacterium]
MRSRIAWTWRIALAVSAFGLALYAFRSGVVVSDRPEVLGAGILTHVYYSLGLFVLGGLDLGVPVQGPDGARIALWFAYFLAPLVTAGVLVESALRLLRPAWIQRQSLRDHIIVVGVGQLGELFLESLYAVDKNPRVLLVDTQESQRLLAKARNQYGAPYVCADIRSASTLDAFNLSRAKGVALLTGDDLVNLEAAWAVLEAEPDMSIVAHIDDIQMKREMDRLMGDAEGQRIRAFNMHHMAADRLYDHHLAPRFEETSARDVVVLVGFGRFGQTMLEHLRREASDELERVVIVDRTAKNAVAAFNMQTQKTAFPVDVVDGDAEDPTVWDQLDALLKNVAHPPVFIFGTDNDSLNFRLAMLLRKRSRSLEIFVRCFHESRFSAQISEHYRIHVMALEQMMHEALEEQQKEWFA